MEISEAKHTDIPEIITLLKKSLGESLLPKSEAYFIWKHYNNPFGESKILLAKESGKIIGVRAFMKWEWSNDEQIFSAVRAVDTATDPEFQGKGIFRTLTMAAVESCKSEGISFVFNSPNQLSIKGYLKMGWYAIGKMPILLSPGSLLPKKFSEEKIDSIYDEYNIVNELEKLQSDWRLSEKNNIMYTPISHHYLKWRYLDCPVARYGAIIEQGNFGIIFRIKKLNRFTELRICEIWTETKSADKKVKAAIKKILKSVRPAMISCAQSSLFESPKGKIPGMWGPFKKGPMVTLRPLANDNLINFNKFYNWNPSIGSMELF
jgi:GNAT superfamily N-acetyltransferase